MAIASIDQLVADHMDFAAGVARRFSRWIPSADCDELESDAMLGLLKAAREFEDQCPFLRFAFKFVYASIVNGLRKRTCWQKQIELAATRVRPDHAEPSPADLAEVHDEVEAIRTGIGEARYARARSARFGCVALSENLGISRRAASARIQKARQIICEEFSACHPSEN